MSDAAARKARIFADMTRVRKRTLTLLQHVPEEFLRVRVHDFYSPIGWHFGHIGMTEEFWVCREALNLPVLDEKRTFLFANLPENPKDGRVHLPERAEIIAYLEATRKRAVQLLETTDIAPDPTSPLLADGYAWEFALRHECQHQETIAEMLQLIQKASVLAAPARGGEEPLSSPSPPDFVFIPGGMFTMGSDDPYGYDNEKRAHPVTVAPFQLARVPVTAREWCAFIENRGYQSPEHWTPDGWAWRCRENAELPEYWVPDAASETGFALIGSDGPRSLDPNEPVSSVSWYEADAFARYCGARLPTEAEWEFAARYDPATGRSRTFPWGDEVPTEQHASFGQNKMQPDPVGSHPAGSSVFGVLDLAGGVWEWTASAFLPYPGFVAFPYDGYSREHMDGNHFVCRGGSWSTAAPVLYSAFRNWYVPTYRQGFLGVRLAKESSTA